MPPPGPNVKNAQKNTFGGFNTGTFYSGGPAPNVVCANPGAVAFGADVLLWSGAGRFDMVAPLPVTASGMQLAVLFYDSAAPTSGGPFPASGHRIVGFIPPYLSSFSGSPAAFASGTFGLNTPVGPANPFSFTFQSGLCVALKSGQPGFTYSFTPEVPNQ
jgi:hypothetical protein